MEPILETNAYQQSAKEFAQLYLKEIFRKGWFVFLPIFGLILGKTIYDCLNDFSPFDFISLLVFFLVILYGRFKLMKALRMNPVFDRKRVLRLYEHCLEIEDDQQSTGQFFFVDIARVNSSKNHYQVSLKTKQQFWIPKHCFQSIEERGLFEKHLKEKGVYSV